MNHAIARAFSLLLVLSMTTVARAEPSPPSTVPEEPVPEPEAPTEVPTPGAPGSTIDSTATGEASPDVDSRTARPQPRHPFVLRGDGSWAYRKLFSLPTTGGDLGLAFGTLPSRSVAIWAAPRFFVGSTENGLSVWSFRPSAEVEFVVDRFRVGAGLGLLVLGVHRAVRSETILSWGVEGRAAARFDVAKTTDFALFIRGGVDAGVEIYDGSAFAGPSLGAGLELFAWGSRPQ